MATDVESLLATYREKQKAARKEAEFYGQMVAEIEAAMPARRRKAKKGAAAKPRKKGKTRRKKPVKAKVSASAAILEFLADSKAGVPVADIITHVSEKYGHQANSLRTTLYNLKKSGKVAQDDKRLYHSA